MSESPVAGEHVVVSAQGAIATSASGELPAAFTEFFRARYRDLIGWAMLLGATVEQAEDMTATSMVQALDRWNELRNPEHFVRTALRRLLTVGQQRPVAADPSTSVEAAESIADEQFERLLDRSSLRTEGARTLRARTPQDHIDRARGQQPLRSRADAVLKVDTAAALRRVTAAAQALHSSGRTADDVRASLEFALASAVAEKGYAATTIADIAANARVSKRTFYEHFSDKEECLMALYGDTWRRMMAVLRATGNVKQPWPDKVRSLTDAYLTTLDAIVNPAVVVAMQAAGVRAYRMRQRVQREFAQTLVGIVDQARASDPRITPLTPPMALALCGGINELMLDIVGPSGEPGASFAGLQEAVVALFTACVPMRPSA